MLEISLLFKKFVLSGKYPLGEMSGRGNVQSEKCPVGKIAARGNVWSRKCQVGELSSRECVSRGSVGRGNVQPRKCPDIVFDVCLVRSLQIFQVQGKISTVRPVFPDYLSVSYDYDWTKIG